MYINIKSVKLNLMLGLKVEATFQERGQRRKIVGTRGQLKYNYLLTKAIGHFNYHVELIA
jgi:hypothetical protein